MAPVAGRYRRGSVAIASLHDCFITQAERRRRNANQSHFKSDILPVCADSRRCAHSGGGGDLRNWGIMDNFGTVNLDCNNPMHITLSFKSFAMVMAAASLMMTGCGSNNNAESSESKSLPRAETTAEMSEAADSLWAKADTEGIEIHSVMVVQNDSVIYEHWANGAHPDSLHVLYSVSKTFTSLGVGMAVADSVLSLDERVADIFPEYLPDSVDENLARMTVRDLLTMSGGYAHAPELYTAIVADTTGADSRPWVERILSYPVEYEPGTVFSYNSMGTYVLSAAVQARIGQKLVDYLHDRLFGPLGIEGAVWEESPDGINTGGWGLWLRTEDLAKAGQLMLDRGRWQGRQLVPSEWIDSMTTRHIESVQGTPNSLEYIPTGEDYASSDWVQGYGYQVWRCRHNAFRADGSFGQFIVVMPDLDAVVVLTANSHMYQKELNLVWDYILPVLERGS